MPIPIVIVTSHSGRATSVGEEVVGLVDDVSGFLGVDWRVEVVRRGGEVFMAVTSFKPLDYGLEVVGDRVSWGLEPAIPHVEVYVGGGEFVARIPDTPYYSHSLYVWRGGDAVVASPWWLVPAVAASAYEGLAIDELYVGGVIAWGYQLSHRALHPSVWRAPLGSVLRITSAGVDLSQGVDYSEVLVGVPSELANLLIKGARSFLEAVAERGLREVRVSLSGGLDSRTVLASLLRASDEVDIKVSAFTIQWPTTDPREVELAKEVAEALGVEHRVVNEDADLNEEGVALASGTGGDRTLAPLNHIKWPSMRGVREMASWLVDRFDYSVDVPPAHDYVRGVRGRMVEKLQGEGRSPLELYRRYMAEYILMNSWTAFGRPFVTPFLYPNFFRLAYRVDPVQKNYYILYAKVLKEVDERLLKVPYYNIGCKLSANKLIQKWKCLACFTLTGLKKVVRGQRGSVVPTERGWGRIELAYNEYIRNKPQVNHPICEVLENAMKWVLTKRPRSARAVVVAGNILRLLKEITALNAVAGKQLRD